MSLIEIRTVLKRFGAFVALRNLSLTVEEGEAVALTGPNGAGKSTLLLAMAGLTRVDRGEVVVDGYNLFRNSEYLKFKKEKSFALLGQENFLYGALSIRENLELTAQLQGVELVTEAIEATLELIGLEHFAHKKVANCSQGLKRRAAFARAILHTPKILLLDEPFANLDSETCEAMVRLVKSLRGDGTTIVFSSHNRDFISRCATRIVSLKDGTVVCNGRKQEAEGE